MNIKTSKILRRTFLGGLGTTAVGSFLRPIVAQAQATANPQRLLVIHRPCGTVMNPKDNPMAPSWWWPTSGTAGGTDWVVAPGGLIDSFNKLRSKMVIMKGTHCPRIQDWLGDKHGAGMVAMISPSPDDPKNSRAAWPVLPGRSLAEQMNGDAKFFTATDRSIDQLFLNTIPTLKAKVPSLQLTPDLNSAKQPDNCLRVISYSKDTTDPTVQPTPLWPEAVPANTFKNVFGSVMMNVDPAQVAQIQAQNKSVIDFISGDLGALLPRLPKSGRDKVDAHLTAIRALEMNLTAQSTGRACTPPSIPDISKDVDARYHQAVLEGMQLIKTAFQCDLTRVISYTFSWGNSDIHYAKFLPNSSSTVGTINGEGYHNISHGGGGDTHDAAQFAIDKYFCSAVAGLLVEMDAIKEGVDGSTMLDNTLVVFWNECSFGGTHDWLNMPTLLFGGKFLKMNGGRYFDYNTVGGRYMSDFWVTTSKAWAAHGVTGYTPITSYGAPMWNKGNLDGIFC